ncbi:MAG: nitrate- and nitrite sensing domain-containing protein, partial [Thiohalophilus sp.]|uniref:nitrate- and nitrite sensing domain-containing protein n=1 Tax=Thiohalophilus sp. TaxID=3028392 RepID=UPI00286FD325
MKALFNPAVYLMNRFRYPIKFGLIFVVVMIPLIVLTSILFSNLDNEIAFLKNERNGLAYIKTAREPVQFIQQHRGLTAAYLNGDETLRNAIMQKRDQVDSALNQLEQVDTRLGDKLQTGNTLSGLQRQWQNIKANAFDMQSAESLKTHSKLVADIMGLISRVADSSEITLDPVLDSYYLGDALVTKLLSLTEAMGKSRAVGSGVAAAGEFTPDKFIQLSILVNEIENNNQSLRNGLNAAFETNPAVAAQLKTAVEENNQAVDSIEHLLNDELLNADTINVDSKTVFDRATEAIDKSYALYDAIVPVLDGLFVDRIQKDKEIEFMAIATVVVVLLIVFYVFAGLYLSVVDNIRRVDEASS